MYLVDELSSIFRTIKISILSIVIDIFEATVRMIDFQLFQIFVTVITQSGQCWTTFRLQMVTFDGQCQKTYNRQ